MTAYLLQTSGLAQEALDPEGRSLLVIFVLRDSGENHNGNGFPGGGCPQHLEDDAPVRLGQVQIEQNEIGPRGRVVVSFAAQKGQGLVPILDHTQLDRHRAFREGVAQQTRRTGMVLNQENLHVFPLSAVVRGPRQYYPFSYDNAK